MHIHPQPQKVTLFGSKVFAEIISQIKVRSFQRRVGLNQMTGVLTRREFGQEHTEPRRCHDGGRDRSAVSSRQGVPTIAGRSTRSQKEARKDLLFRESMSWRHLDLGFWSLQLGENKFLLFQVIQVYRDLPQWPQEPNTALRCPVQLGFGELIHSKQNLPTAL